jgi:tetratricopeptide (TPR) repeat protein
MSGFGQNLALTRAVQSLQTGQLHQAEAICRQVLAERRGEHLALAILGQIETMRSRHDEALRHLERAVAIAPREVDYHVLLAEALATCGRHQEALRRYDRALRLRRDHAPALAGKANVYARTEAWERARRLLEPFVRRGAEDAGMAVVYARAAIHDGEHDRAIEVAQRHLRDPVRDEVRRSLHFEIARGHDQAGRHDEAFQSYTRAHEVSRGAWEPAAHAALHERIMRAFDAERLAAAPSPDPATAEASEHLVFIVGMPRSGSTLIEQIIDAHPEAFGAGELLLLPDLVESMPLRIGSSLAYPECVADLEPADAEALAAGYLQGIRTLAPQARRICDKHLGNYQHLGLVAVLFPRARIIHCRRDPLDTCLSCYMQKFAPGTPAYTQDLRLLGLAYNDYLAIMDHWRAVLPPGRLLEVDYEMLVEEQEGQSRRIIDFCGLPWDDRCLRFHESGREVLTLSRAQVNRPIYGSARGRWRRYEKHLGPLREVLEKGLRGEDLR